MITTRSSNPWLITGLCATAVIAYASHNRADDWTDTVLPVLVSLLVTVVSSMWWSARTTRINYGQHAQLIVVADHGQRGRRVKDLIPENLSGIAFVFVSASRVETTAHDIEYKLHEAQNKYFRPPPGGEHNRRLPVIRRYFRDPKTGKAHETQEEYERNLFKEAEEIDNNWMSYLRSKDLDGGFIKLFLASHRNGSVS